MPIYGPLMVGNTYIFQQTSGGLPLTVKGMLGQGGFGIIYLVEDEKGKRQAVKFPGVEVDLENDLLIDRLCAEYQITIREKSERKIEVYRKVIIGYGKYQSFQKEIEYLAKHACEHVIPIEPLRLFSILCYRMPYYHNTLRDKMEAIKNGELENPELFARFLTLAWKVARVLKKIHEQGLVHRDIKPENIFLENEWQPENSLKDWEPVVGDFGVAGQACLTGYWSVVGDLRYMSPSQKEGREIRGEDQYKSDVYALGIILKEIFANAQLDRQLECIITKATEENLENGYDSAKFSYALEEYMKPRISELLQKYQREKNWNTLAEWVDYCWDFLPQREREYYLELIWTQKISSPFELHFFHKSKPNISEKERLLWKNCHYFYEKDFSGIVDLLALQIKGRHRYLLSEQTTEPQFPIHTDKELLQFVCQLKDILTSLKQIGVKMKPSRSNLCQVGERLCFIPWRGDWRFAGKQTDDRQSDKILAQLALYFWVGEKIAPGWLPDDSFYQQKYDCGWNDEQYLDELTKILLNAAAESLKGCVAESLQIAYRNAKINEIKKRAHQAYNKVKQYSKLISEHVDEDLDPYCFTEFYKACEILLQAACGILEQEGFCEKDCQQRLDEINQLLSPSLKIVFSDILPEKISTVAAKALGKLENFSQPVRLCVLNARQWREIFYQQPENFDAEKLAELVGENIYLLKAGHEGEISLCLMRQKNKQGVLLKEKYAQNKCALADALKVVEKALDATKRLQPLVKSQAYFNLLDLYRDRDGTIYFDWLDVPAPCLEPMLLDERWTQALAKLPNSASELLGKILCGQMNLSSLISSLKQLCIIERKSVPNYYRLEILKTPAESKSSALEIAQGEKILIGRYRNRDSEYGKSLTIVDPKVSKYHVVVELIGECLRLRDCNSRNGTFIEGKKVEEESILPGTTFQLGDSIILFEKINADKVKPKQSDLCSLAFDGESLEELVDRIGALEIKDAARITKKIAEILKERAKQEAIFSIDPRDVLLRKNNLQLLDATTPAESVNWRNEDSTLILGYLFYYLITQKRLPVPQKRSKGISDLLAYLLYGQEPIYLRIPLLWEKRNPSCRTLPENILEILLLELPEVLELEKDQKFVEFLDDIDLCKESCWRREFVETLEQDRMFQLIKELRLLILQLQDMPSFTNENNEALQRKLESLSKKVGKIKEKLAFHSK